MVQTKQEAPYKPPVLFLGGSCRVRLSRAWTKKEATRRQPLPLCEWNGLSVLYFLYHCLERLRLVHG